MLLAALVAPVCTGYAYVAASSCLLRRRREQVFVVHSVFSARFDVAVRRLPGCCLEGHLAEHTWQLSPLGLLLAQLEYTYNLHSRMDSIH